MRSIRNPLGVLLVGLFVTACDAPAPEAQAPAAVPAAEPQVAADWILTNGQILTADTEFSIVEAIAIDGDRVLAVGNNDDILGLADADTEVTDLEGQTVVPGLIDNHMHFVRASRDWYRHVRWDGIRSREQALEMVRKRAAELPPGEWVVVLGGWNFSQFADNSDELTRAELDGIARTVPIYIQQNYRRGFANSAALAAAGIDATSVYEGGGQLIRDADGEPTGEFVGGPAMAFITQHMPDVSPDLWDRSLAWIVESMNRMGMTTVYDVGGNQVTPSYYDAVHRADENNMLNMRVYYTLNERNLDLSTPEKIVEALQSNTPDYDGLKVARFGYGETVYRPFRANPFVISAEDQEHFYDISVAAAENGWQLNDHSSRDVKVQLMLDIFERVNETHPITDMRWTIAHNNTTSPESVQRGMDLGTVFAVHSSRRNVSAEQAANGGEAGLHQPPIGMINERGAIWGLGSDATYVASPNPFHTLGWAVSGRSNGGDITLVDTVSREDALVAHTRTNAYTLFREDDLGSLEPGKLADFIVVDRDYLTVPAEEIENLYSVMTVVGGEVVYSE
ncbi:MAG: amidohydrolase [Gammaproteobacteria bacterium]